MGCKVKGLWQAEAGGASREPLVWEAQSCRLQVRVFKAQVHSSTHSTKPLAFYGKTDFYLKNKLALPGEKERAFCDPIQRWAKGPEVLQAKQISLESSFEFQRVLMTFSDMEPQTRSGV